jgi:hypothetical protein
MYNLQNRLFIVTGALIISWTLFISVLVLFWTEITGTEKNVISYNCELADLASTPIEVRAKCKALKR